MFVRIFHWLRGTTNEQHWRSIARACACVVTLCQRDQGLWSWPANDAESKYSSAKMDGTEDLIRREQEFGFESITNTWDAIRTLNYIFGECPRDMLQHALARLDKCRNTQGAYGSSSESGRDGIKRFNASTRHTGMALLIRLDFENVPSPADRLALYERTIDWILDTQLETGGWAFDHETTEECTSTAACIAALARFLADGEVIRYVSQNFDEVRFATYKSKIETKLSNGVQRLRQLKSSNLWTSEIWRSVSIIDLLSWAVDKGRWAVDERKSGELALVVSTLISDAEQTLMQLALGDGWPQIVNGKTRSLGATIFAMFFCSRSPPQEKGRGIHN